MVGWLLWGALAMAAAGGESVPSVVKGWTTEDGLPSNRVTALAQTADGYLWVGTGAGLARFDGRRFVPFGRESGFSALPVRYLTALKGGGLWVRDGKGDAYWLRDGRFVPGKEWWRFMATGSDGEVYAYSASRVVKLDADGAPTHPPVSFPQDRSPGGRMLHVDARGRILVLLNRPDDSGRDLMILDGGEWQLLSRHEPMERVAEFLGTGLDGAFWVGPGAGEDAALFRFDAGGGSMSLPHPEFRVMVAAMEEDGAGRLWMAPASGGLWQWDGEGPRLQRLAGDGFESEVTVLLRGRGGELWAGTSDRGLFRILPARVQSHRLDDEATGSVYALQPVPGGSILVGTEGSGILRWEKGRKSLMTENAEFSGRFRYCYDFLPMGESLWVATRRGLHEFDPEGRVWRSDPAFADLVGKPGGDVFSLCEDGEGGLWVGTGYGRIFRVKGRTVREVDFPDRHRQAFVAMVRDDSGTLWVAGIQRIARISPDETVTVYGKEHGMPEVKISCLFRDSRGRMWLGTQGQGLFRWDGEYCHPVPAAGPRRLVQVMQIQEDADGWLWLGTLNGICGFDPSVLPDPVQPLWLGSADGMDSEQCTPMEAARDAQGNLYFGTTRGFSVVDPAAVKLPPRLPRPVIEELNVEMDGVSRNRLEEGDVPPGGRFEVTFTALDPEVADDTEFRCRLGGLEDDWVSVTDSRTRKFGRVPPGVYRFELQAGRNGVWNPDVAVLPVRVVPYFWETWWFQPLVAIAVLGAAAGGVKLYDRRRLRAMQAEMERIRAVNEERRRIARDLHDGLGAGLAQVSLLAQLRGESPGGANPGDLHDRLKSLAIELDHAVWATNPVYDDTAAVCDYLVDYAVEYLAGTGIRCEIDAPAGPPRLPLLPAARHNLLQAVCEALANVVKHAGAKRVRFTVRVGPRQMTVIVQDDGRGFDRAAVAARNRRNGLGNMEARLRAAGGTAAISPTAIGTTVELSVPVVPRTDEIVVPPGVETARANFPG